MVVISNKYHHSIHVWHFFPYQKNHEQCRLYDKYTIHGSINSLYIYHINISLQPRTHDLNFLKVNNPQNNKALNFQPSNKGAPNLGFPVRWINRLTNDHHDLLLHRNIPAAFRAPRAVIKRNSRRSPEPMRLVSKL